MGLAQSLWGESTPRDDTIVHTYFVFTEDSIKHDCHELINTMTKDDLDNEKVRLSSGLYTRFGIKKIQLKSSGKDIWIASYRHQPPYGELQCSHRGFRTVEEMTDYLLYILPESATYQTKDIIPPDICKLLYKKFTRFPSVIQLVGFSLNYHPSADPIKAEENEVEETLK